MTHARCTKDFRNREKRSSRSLRSNLNSVSTRSYYFESKPSKLHVLCATAVYNTWLRDIFVCLVCLSERQTEASEKC